MIIFTILPTTLERVQRTLDSLMRLSNVNWILVYKDPIDVNTAELLRLTAFAEERIIRYTEFLAMGMIADFIVPLVEGDQVLPRIRCLHENGLPKGAQWAYADTVICTGDRSVIWAKPDFSPELQLVTNFIQRPIFTKADVSETFVGDEVEIYARFSEWQSAF